MIKKVIFLSIICIKILFSMEENDQGSSKSFDVNNNVEIHKKLFSDIIHSFINELTTLGRHDEISKFEKLLKDVEELEYESFHDKEEVITILYIASCHKVREIAKIKQVPCYENACPESLYAQLGHLACLHYDVQKLMHENKKPKKRCIIQ